MSTDLWTGGLKQLHDLFWEWRFQEISVEEVLPAAVAATREQDGSPALSALASLTYNPQPFGKWRRRQSENLLLKVASEYEFFRTDEQALRRQIVRKAVIELARPGSPARMLADRIHFVGQAFLPYPEDDELVSFIVPEEDWGRSDEEVESQSEVLRAEARAWLNKHPESTCH